MSKDILPTTTTAARLDMNQDAARREMPIKKSTNINKESINRAALGNLDNRTIGHPNTTNSHKEGIASKEVHRLKFQNIKPKVDSHWKKSSETVAEDEMVAPTTLKSTNSTKIPEPTGNAATKVALVQKKVLTRSNSVRLVSTKGVSDIKQKVGVEKTKTFTTTKVIEKKLPKLKVAVTKTANNVALTAANSNANKVHIDEKPIVNLNLKKGNNELSQKPSVSTEDNDAKTVPLTVSAQIRDIDDESSNTIILVQQYVNDIYSYLYDLENKNSILQSSMKDQLEINGKMRAVLIDWISEVAHQFHLLLETFQLSVTIIDRYLNVVKNTKRTELQLVGATALFAASKYEEMYPPSSNDFAYITDNSYTVKQICQMEKKIFKAIEFNLSWPLPIHFLRRFSKAADAKTSHHNMAKYFMELITLKPDMTHYKPSKIAAASLFLALNLLNSNAMLPTGFNDALWTPTIEHYSRYRANQLKSISQQMAIAAYEAPNAKLKAAYVKYQSTKFEKISMQPELYGPLMVSIIEASSTSH